MFLIFILVANLCIHAAKGYTVLQIEIMINNQNENMKNMPQDLLELEENEKPITDMDINQEEDSQSFPVDWTTTCTLGCDVNWIHV